ncbi:M10 family metallopeptidase C-terminal domain-containing protein [Shimia sp.]|uniref:M10 family metallopeptidase C-terminal domain-containing protein n=1 Tax=Shimia sp. TaxID=1954381 RepID=UPI00356693FB
MPELELQAHVDDPAASYLAGICDLELYHGPEGLFLYATTRGGGGLTVFEITGSGLVLRDQQALPVQGLLVPGSDLELLEIGGATTALVSGIGLASPPAWQLSGDGGFGAAGGLGPGFDGMAAQYFAVEVAGETYLYASWAGSSRISAYQLAGDGSLTLIHDTPATPVAGIGTADFASLEVAGTVYLLAAMSAEDRVVAYAIGADGALVETGSAGAATGLPIADPVALTALTLDGTGYVVTAAAGSSSLTVLRLDAEGQLIATDQVIDGLEQRFSGACQLESLVVDGRAYVLAAGDDDGLSLFQILPDGRLLHLDSLADSDQMGLAGVSALAMGENDGVLEIYVASGAEAGLTVLSYDPGPVGLTLSGGDAGERLAGGADHDILYGAGGDDTLLGGAGDDVLIDGTGSDLLSGGEGADIFVMTHDGERDRITDFDPAEDRLDLSALPLLHDADQLTVIPVPGGADLYFADELLEIRTLDGSSLEAAEVAEWSLVPLDRVPLAPTLPPQPQQGTPGPDRLLGGSGDDILYGHGGADLLEGGDGDDRLEGGEGDDTLVGGRGSDTLLGGAGSDTASYATAPGAVTARLDGGAGTGMATGDSLSGIENLIGSPYDDALVGSRDANALSGAEGDDLLLGQGGGDRLTGGTGRDILLGGTGGDRLTGESGRDILLGGSGDDLLDGGRGADVFIFQGGSDRITDFEDDRDLLVLDRAALGLAPDSGAGDLAALATPVAEGLLLSFADGSSLTLEGVDSPALLADDLLLI